MRLPKMFHFILDGIPSYARGIAIEERPDIPAPSKDYYSPGDVTGVDGSYYEDLGTFRNVEVEIKCNFISNDSSDWHRKWRIIKNWILGSKHKVLRFSDDEGYFRKIAKATLSTSERRVLLIGSFSIHFEFEPFEYLDSGLHELDCSMITKNDNYTSHPIYHITGDGNCTLTVNDRQFKVLCVGETFIDTDLKIAYNRDGSLATTDGDYESLWLENGKCSIHSTFACKVQPNWRCI